VAKTRAQENRAIRQEALREQLSKQGHVQHVVEIATQLSDPSNELDSVMASRLKAAADIRMKLIAKYLGDVKAVEITGEGGEALTINVQSFKDA
tara:strand:- start:347 stop:628 length:282 start_codon:yes stop_codon:yes gene_type:complete